MQQSTGQIGVEQGEKIELFFSATNLSNKDGVFGKSDPHLQLWETSSLGGAPRRMIGKTEVVKNNLNPTWSTSFEYFFVFEAQQFLQIKVVDSDDGKNDDALGIADLELVNIITKGSGQGYEVDLKIGGVNRGKVRVRYEKQAAENNLFTISAFVSELKTGCCSRNDVFMKIYRPQDSFLGNQNGSTIPSNGWICVQETEHYLGNLSPKYLPFEITGARLCKNNINASLKVELFDFREDGFHVSLGFGFANIQDLMKGQPSIQTGGGKVTFNNFTSIKLFSLLDLINQGMQMSLYVAIDFTGSNGIPSIPSSLHYMNPNLQLNGYENVITSVGGILQEYDSQKRFPVYGFGATYGKAGITSVSHCFPLTGKTDDPFVFGVPGILGVYRESLPFLSFSGPTNFSPIITECTKSVRFATQSGVFSYSTLLILTDGQITDMDKTIDAIIDASGLPISIIIIGIGNADFSSMEALDSDKGLLRSKLNPIKIAQRDIVQFVQFNQFNGNLAALSNSVLKELPNQVSKYYGTVGIPKKK